MPLGSHCEYATENATGKPHATENALWERHCERPTGNSIAKMLGKYVFSEFLRCFLDFWLFSVIFGYFCICHTFLDFPWEISFCRDFRSFPEFRENLRKSAKNTRNNTKIPEKYENTQKIPQTIRKYPKNTKIHEKIPQTIRKYPKQYEHIRNYAKTSKNMQKIPKKYPKQYETGKAAYRGCSQNTSRRLAPGAGLQKNR